MIRPRGRPGHQAGNASDAASPSPCPLTRLLGELETAGEVWGHWALEREVRHTRVGFPTAPRSPMERYLLGVRLCDGRAAVGCPRDRTCGLRGTLSPPAGGSCSSDPRWPWPTKGTTASCAGSPPGPGAGESLSDAQVRPPGSVRRLHPEEPPSGLWGRPRNSATAPAPAPGI